VLEAVSLAQQTAPVPPPMRITFAEEATR